MICGKCGKDISPMIKPDGTMVYVHSRPNPLCESRVESVRG